MKAQMIGSSVKLVLVTRHHMYGEAVKAILGEERFPGTMVISPDRLFADRQFYPFSANMVFIIDVLDMPGPDVAMMAWIRRMNPEASLIALGTFESVKSIGHFLRLGVRGFVKRSTGIIDLEKAISQVVRGAFFLPEDWDQSARDTTLY